MTERLTDADLAEYIEAGWCGCDAAALEIARELQEARKLVNEIAMYETERLKVGIGYDEHIASLVGEFLGGKP